MRTFPALRRGSGIYRLLAPRPALRWRALIAGVAAVACAVAFTASAADPAKVLRIAQFDIDTLDPQQYTDDPSFQVIMAIFEPVYEWDYLSPTPRLTPLTAAAPPEVTDGGRVWTLRLKRGILFTDDPAFKGKPRELIAEDYVFAYKRWLDPNGRRGGNPILTDLVLGARPVVEAAKKAGKFDFDAPLEGLRALDRYTLQIRMRDPDYPNLRDMLSFVGAVAREVVEAAGPDLRVRAVGTGAYRVKEWKRGSRLTLEANPGYREAYFPESNRKEDAELTRSMKGKRVPFAGTVEVNIIDEDLTRLLLFEQGGLDFVQLRGEIATRLLADGKVKPEYAARGITRTVIAEPFLFSLYFNTKDPVVGGMTNERIALRRAIALGWDADALIRIVLAGQAIPANQMVPPGVGGHDPELPVKSPYDPATASALLDRFGYDKRDADGFRRAPDGKRLALTLSLRTGGIMREVQTLWKKNMEAIGLRTEFNVAPFQEIIKDLEKGKFQMYQGGFGGSPSGYNQHAQLHSKQPQRVNTVQFANAEYDRAAEEFLRSPSDEDQLAAARAMSGIARTYMPLMPVYFRLESIYVQPWLQGFRPGVFSSYWKYLDIDLARRK
ncbi:MAG: ABC transporter substrate-binding protein [Casimicrobiaceae bacterium]